MRRIEALSKEYYTRCEFSPELYKSHFEAIYGMDYRLVFGDEPLYSSLFRLLRENYKNEYYVKRAFFISRLLSKKAVTGFELPVGESRADIVSFNGTSTAYEVKTLFDNLDRLEKQIRDYASCFEKVYVVTDISKIKDVLGLIDRRIGIYAYDTNRLNPSFVKKREATCIPEFLNAESMLRVMTKQEIFANLGISDREKAKLMSLKTVNAAFKKAMKQRYMGKWESLKKECVEIKDFLRKGKIVLP